MDIKVIIAAHKPYWMPIDDCYLPLHVGKEGKNGIGFIGDNTGDHISAKNANYCELTGIYWAWKNLKTDYIGVCHYRRYFTNGNPLNIEKKRAVILKRAEFEKILQKTNIIVPDKRHYYIETTRKQYEHAHNPADLAVTESIIKERYAEYLPSFKKVMDRTWGHRFNMFVMRKDYFDEYCTWLFDILFELEKRIDISSYDNYNARVFGFISERLLDVWLETNKLLYVEQNVCYMEKQNWLVKGGKFLKRKLLG
ncbi:MAG: DUF4422 domain-containing protein [Negativicutes bacterium]|nr:DUF4422 domain-containing protein [Negativicutes bacterium]